MFRNALNYLRKDDTGMVHFKVGCEGKEELFIGSLW